jgi:predicted nucleic acid-binding protein
MERQKKVVDASVVVKWFVNEKGNEEAHKLKEEHLSGKITLIVPELIFLEVINALRFKKSEVGALDRSVKYLLETFLHIEQLNQYILQKAIEVSLKYDLSMYDAVYGALAQIHGCALVTVDRKLGKIPGAVGL